MSAFLFDSYVMIDWSAASTPVRGANSVWFAHAARQPDGRLVVAPPCNPPTRQAAREAIAALLEAELAAGRRVLVGCDFPFGYPAGLAAALEPGREPGREPGQEPAWRAVWRTLEAAIADGPTNRNNRFVVAGELNRLGFGRAFPFWGCPAGSASEWLTPTRPKEGWGEGGLAEWRVAERHAPGAQSPWKICYTGSVGGQALVGLPVLAAWRFAPALEGKAAVWPFETGLRPLTSADTASTPIVFAEIYPSMLRLEGDDALVKDARQVLSLARRFAAMDEAATLGGRFDGPASLTAEERARIRAEEGWILAP